MSNDERKSTDVLTIERELLKRTRERDDAELRLLKIDKALVSANQELEESARRDEANSERLLVSNALLESKDLELAERTANLATSSLELSQRTAELYETNRFLAAKTAQLEAANQSLMKAMQQKEDFVAALTHDLKNPIVGTTRVLEHLLEAPALCDGTHQVAIKTVINANKTMLRMIVNMLDVYKQEAGSIVPLLENVYLPELLESCITEFAFAASDKSLDLQSDCGNTGEIQSDRMLLRRILVNLIDNAVKFTPASGKVRIIASELESRVLISVEDSGKGLNELERRGIFRKYWQTNEGRMHGIGTGLGLHASKQLVEILGGTITCESEVGHGAKFILSLPLKGKQ